MGILVAMAILVVLFAVLMNSLNVAVTGAGNTTSGSVHSLSDQLQLTQMAQACFIAGQNNGLKGAPTPSQRLGAKGTSSDTTANVFSLLIAERYADPSLLVSKNERSPNVWERENYNYQAVQPSQRSYWDENFKADLTKESNVSFAHVPLCGSRSTYWTEVRLDTRFPLMGSRGPANGQPNPASMTYGRDNRWGGFHVFGDGHVEFTEIFTAKNMQLEDGSADNVYAMEGEAEGGDAILAFTLLMREGVPTLQWD
ncbi:MAG: hypothetical protein JNL80_18540 [Phycisphaerae bacterium]|nr:hypothetical protein [Phycisphaerae bacterium]